MSTERALRLREPAQPRASVTGSPSYKVVIDYLKNELARGRWAPGTQMPSEADLVNRFGFSRMTIHRAVRELQAAGLVRRVRGAGTFAAQLHRVSSTLTIHDIHDEIASRGHTHRAEVHIVREERVSARLSERFGMPVGALVYHSVIVHHENDTPLQYEDRYVNPKCAPDYLAIDFTRTTPTHYLLEVAPVWEAQYSIESSTPSAREARLLKIARDQPCLVVLRRTANNNAPVTFVRLVYPGSRYQLEGRFKP
jgi:GntR family histidine utilization transcriptional repressor